MGQKLSACRIWRASPGGFVEGPSEIGPLKALDFNIPTAKTENLYFTSINATVTSMVRC